MVHRHPTGLGWDLSLPYVRHVKIEENFSWIEPALLGRMLRSLCSLAALSMHRIKIPDEFLSHILTWRVRKGDYHSQPSFPTLQASDADIDNSLVPQPEGTAYQVLLGYPRRATSNLSRHTRKGSVRHAGATRTRGRNWRSPRQIPTHIPPPLLGCGHHKNRTASFAVLGYGSRSHQPAGQILFVEI